MGRRPIFFWRACIVSTPAEVGDSHALPGRRVSPMTPSDAWRHDEAIAGCFASAPRGPPGRLASKVAVSGSPRAPAAARRHRRRVCVLWCCVAKQLWRRCWQPRPRSRDGRPATSERQAAAIARGTPIWSDWSARARHQLSKQVCAASHARAAQRAPHRTSTCITQALHSACDLLPCAGS